MSWLTFKTKKSTIDCHYRWFTIILADSRCVKWKWDSIIVLKERIYSFSQIHDHSRWLTSFREDSFCCFTYEDVMLHDFFRENFRFVDMKMLYVNFSFNSRRRHASWFLSKRTSHFDDLILLTRVFRRAICFKAKDLIECQLVSQSSEREILLCWRREDDLVIVTAVDREISCWKWAIVTNCLDLVSFYSLIVW